LLQGLPTSSRPFVEPLSIVGVRSNNSKNVQAADIVPPISSILYKKKMIKTSTRDCFNSSHACKNFGSFHRIVSKGKNPRTINRTLNILDHKAVVVVHIIIFFVDIIPISTRTRERQKITARIIDSAAASDPNNGADMYKYFLVTLRNTQ